MGKGRFLNQKLGKRMSRKSHFLKSQLAGRPNPAPSGKGKTGYGLKSPNLRFPKKGISREA